MHFPDMANNFLSWLMGMPPMSSGLVMQTLGSGTLMTFNTTANDAMSMNCNRLMNNDRSYCAQAVGRFDKYQIYSSATSYVGRVKYDFNTASNDSQAGCVVTLNGNFTSAGGVNGTVVWEMVSQLYDHKGMGVCGSATFSNGCNVTLDMCEGNINCRDHDMLLRANGGINNDIAANSLKTPVTGLGPGPALPPGSAPDPALGPDSGTDPDAVGDIFISLPDMSPGPVNAPPGMVQNLNQYNRPDHPGPNMPPLEGLPPGYFRSGKHRKCRGKHHDPNHPECAKHNTWPGWTTTSAGAYIPPAPAPTSPSVSPSGYPSGYPAPAPPPVPAPPPPPVQSPSSYPAASQPVPSSYSMAFSASMSGPSPTPQVNFPNADPGASQHTRLY